MENLESLKLAIAKKKTRIYYPGKELRISFDESFMDKKMNLAYQVIGTKENAQKLYARLKAM